MWLKTLLSVSILASALGAPQFQDDNRPMPYSFGYGVNVADTQDVKEHTETSENGRVEGMYRWLQPNGLYRVVRYYVDGDSGFVAEVSEEPGPDVENYSNSNLGSGSNSVGLGGVDLRTQAVSGQSVATNIGNQQTQSFSSQNSFNSQQDSRNQQQSSFQASNNVNSNSGFGRQQQQQSFISEQQSFSSQNQQKSFASSSQTRGSTNADFIDGGIIQGKIIDGGIINPEALDF